MREPSVADELAWSALPDDLREQYRLAIYEEVRRELLEDIEWRQDEFREEGAEKERDRLRESISLADDALEELATALSAATQAIAEIRGEIE